MREGIIVALVCLLVGGALIFLASRFLPQVAYLPLIANVLGAISVLLAPVVLITTFIATVLPRSKDKLDKCDH
jgi:uncharacterized BrkB/YihY/UPF0761 family membrane protein